MIHIIIVIIIKSEISLMFHHLVEREQFIDVCIQIDSAINEQKAICVCYGTFQNNWTLNKTDNIIDESWPTVYYNHEIIVIIIVRWQRFITGETIELTFICNATFRNDSLSFMTKRSMPFHCIASHRIEYGMRISWFLWWKMRQNCTWRRFDV